MAEGCPVTREGVEKLMDPGDLGCYLCGEPAAFHRWAAAFGANEAAIVGAGSAPAYTKQDVFVTVGVRIWEALLDKNKRLRVALAEEHGVGDLPVRHEPPCAVCDLLWPGPDAAKKGSGHS